MQISQLTESIIAGVSFLGVNISLIAVVVYFGKKWINRMESDITKNKEEARDEIILARKELAITTSNTTEELKILIRENKETYNQHSNDIKESIKEMIDQMRVANGRTRKNELSIEAVRGLVNTQIALCQDRNGGRRAYDKCAKASIAEENDPGGII
jgi:gas vesicle protein